MKTVTFLNEKCTVEYGQYQNGRTAIQLICEDGCPMATATVNVDAPLGKNEVVIKDYSENEGMLHALVEAGVVAPTGKSVQTGFTVSPIAELVEEV